jgi:hypothetical protein
LAGKWKHRERQRPFADIPVGRILQLKIFLPTDGTKTDSLSFMALLRIWGDFMTGNFSRYRRTPGVAIPPCRKATPHAHHI